MTKLPPTVDNPRLRQFHEYWRGKMRDGRLPGRADIDPVEIPDLLRSITLVEIVEDGGKRRYRVRLFGTDHVQYNGRDLTGMFVDEAFAPEDLAKVTEVYDRMADGGEPHHWRMHVLTPGREFVHYERLMLPLASDGANVDMLIGVFDFDRIEPPENS
jgi:hypothetical protein